MPILSGDIKLVASQVMDDVPEGGGAATGIAIIDGTSNAIFPDISELDRAGGRVNLRKLHVSVQTADTDTYMGANVIVAEPPADPNVSITLFTTHDAFDTRTSASSRVESYLNKGPLWGGFLLENHIAGQRSVQVLQRPLAELPAVGQTLVLVGNEGLSTQYEQYVRTTAVTAVDRVFWDDATTRDFTATVVTCAISDALRSDFTGTAANARFKADAGACKLRDTVVADAGSYVGVVPLKTAAAIGDFTLVTTSIFTQLVPSSQAETPISDVRTNGLATALVAAGGAVSQTLSLAFTTTQNLFLGGPVYPGSLSIVREGVTLTDKGGLLVNAGAEVGQIDYDNGISSLSTNVWGTGGGTYTVSFVPAAVPDLISDQRSIPITAESRSLSYAFTMDDVPVPRTLSLSYRAQGRWYVLRDDGSGALRGISTAHGVGTLSQATGSISVTLGALPDVGSRLIVQSYSKATTMQISNTTLRNSSRVYIPINTEGLTTGVKGTRALMPGLVGVSWDDGTARLAADDGNGHLTGDATGEVDYANGLVYFSPNLLPAAGTTITVGITTAAVSIAPGVTWTGGTLGSNIEPGSVSALVPVTASFTASHPSYVFTLSPSTVQENLHVSDDGLGNLIAYSASAGTMVVVGTINYTTGAFAISPAAIATGMGLQDSIGPNTTIRISGLGYLAFWLMASKWNDLVFDAGYTLSRSLVLATPSGSVSFSNSSRVVGGTTAQIDHVVVQTLMVPNYTLKGVGFTLGSTRYQQITDGTLLKDVLPTTGGGTPAGNVLAATGLVNVSSWPTGASSLLADWRGLIAPPAVGVEAPFTAIASTFRTASSPIRPGSLSVLGTMQDGTEFNVTADANGKINGTRVKGTVDYQYGVIDLYCVNPAGDPAYNVDLSSLGIAGLTTIPSDLVMLNSIRYNAVSYSYLPLDAAILGIDPVRLPSDGRVPIFRPGGFAVAGHTGKITATVTNGQTIDCARVRLSRVRVVGLDNVVINTGYTADLDAGTVTFTSVAGYSQPVTVEHRIEDMAVVNDVQIGGEVTFTRALTHAYPLGSYLSSALVAGDLKARVSILFDQATWNGTTWLDAVSGSASTGTYNAVLAPVVVTNIGAQSERWALVFTNATTFNIVGEHVGVIGTGNTGVDTAPLNPATGVPYFTVAALGWGTGWSVGNVLRINTVGAMTPVWVARTIQQGPNTGTQHSFTLLSRGDVDQP